MEKGELRRDIRIVATKLQGFYVSVRSTVINGPRFSMGCQGNQGGKDTEGLIKTWKARMPGRGEEAEEHGAEPTHPHRIRKRSFLSRCPVHIYILAANDNYFATISCKSDNSGVIGKRY